MIHAPQLLADLPKLLKRLEGDLLQRIEEHADLKAGLQAEWQAARDADRCAETFETWVDQVITQAGVHWLLSCVFLRFIEDNQLVDRPWLGGTPESGRLTLARDRHEAYFSAHPLENDRDYLLTAFSEAGTLPGLHTFFDEAHNPVFRLGVSGDAAMALRQFWQQVDPNTGALLHDFTDPAWNTRFLGDLYQDLSEATRKRYALLQTPEFVEEFILDRTLTPAIREFGFRDVRMIDPTCGSGHFLLGGFHRLLDLWQRNEPGRNPVDLAQKALDAVAGVDLNPFAVAISRFRLFVAALKASGVQRLADAHDFRVHVAIGDSLLHGTRFGLTQTDDMFDAAQTHADTGLAHAYASEDLTEVQRILGRQYHAVVGNPPYIVVRDTALNAAYRNLYASCHRQYSLGAPFTERFFQLAITAERFGRAGFVGLITANSFMKREFGSKLIEEVLPRLDLTHVIDTSGAYIPGHGTPTVILLGRHRPPYDDLRSPSNTVRAVMGIKGEPSKPDDATQGLVWRAIVNQIDHAGSESAFVSVADMPRSALGNHPWSIGGGGAAEVLDQLSMRAGCHLKDLISVIGRTTHTGEDSAFFVTSDWVRRNDLAEYVVPLVEGEDVRDYLVDTPGYLIFPYDKSTAAVLEALPPALANHFWFYRRSLKARKDFGNYIEDRGLRWYEHSMFFPERFRSALGLPFAFVATHNHFVLDRGGKVFNRSAPVVKLRAESTEEVHQGTLGVLNSSVACFWMKQVFYPKGGDQIGGEGARVSASPWEDRYEFAATGMKDFPVPPRMPTTLAKRLDALARDISKMHPRSLFSGNRVSSRDELTAAHSETISLRRRMIAAQEELDWQCYHLYGLLPESSEAMYLESAEAPELALGERAFEIVLARRIAAGDETTSWFERHGSTPITEIPAHWPADYRAIVQRRIALMESNRNIGLIERPEFKRRWNTPAWDDVEKAALHDWLLDRLEAPALWPASADHPPQLSSTSRLADAVSRDAEFMQIAGLYAGHADFDLPQLVAELVAAEAVPALPVQRYTDTGLRKREQWEATWALQRREDAGEDVGKIPVPPKYQSKDFLKADFWRLRGGLDVPKERWVSYPGCERGADGSLVIAWAGWNHLQQATALASYYLEMKENEGWEPTRLQPLLASLQELVPWLLQWHNDIDPAFGERMGDYYRDFVNLEARSLGFTLDDLRTWKPVAVAIRRGRPRRQPA